MSNKKHKETARNILSDIFNAKGSYKTKFKAEFTGLALNEKGGFYSALIDVDLSIKHPDGVLIISKTIQLPINMVGEVDIPESIKKSNEAVDGNPDEIHE